MAGKWRNNSSTADISATRIVGNIARKRDGYCKPHLLPHTAAGRYYSTGLRGRAAASGRTTGGFAPLLSAGQRASAANDSPEQRTQFSFSRAFVGARARRGYRR